MIISTYPKVKFYIENPYTNHLVSRIIFTSVYFIMSFPYGSVGKESVCNVGDPGAIPGWGRSPGEGKGSPLQYSGLENSMDCIAHGVAESDMTEQLPLLLHFALSYIHPCIISLDTHLSFLPPTHPSGLCFIYSLIFGCAGSELLRGRSVPSLWCSGFSFWWLLWLASMASRACRPQEWWPMGLVDP